MRASRIAFLAVLVVPPSLVACVKSSGFEPPGTPSGENTNFVIVAGESYPLEAVHASLREGGEPVAPGKAMLASGFLRQQIELDFFLDLQDVAPGVYELKPYGVPDLRFLHEGEIYVALEGTLELFAGGLDERDSVSFELRDLRVESACGDTLAVERLRAEAPVTYDLLEQVADDVLPPMGFVEGLLVETDGSEVSVAGPAITERTTLSSSGNPAWSTEAYGQCHQPLAYSLKLLLDLTQATAGELPVSLDDYVAPLFAYRLEGGTVVAQFVAIEGTVELDATPTDASRQELEGRLRDVTLRQFSGNEFVPDVPPLRVEEARLRMLFAP